MLATDPSPRKEGRPRRMPSELSTSNSRVSFSSNPRCEWQRASAHSRSSSPIGFSRSRPGTSHSHRSPKSSASHPMPPPVLRLFAAAPPRALGGRARARRGDGGFARLRLRVRAAAGEAAPAPSRTQVNCRLRALLRPPPPFQPAVRPYCLCAALFPETRRGCSNLCAALFLTELRGLNGRATLTQPCVVRVLCVR